MRSINQTLSRTILTAVTTLLALTALYLSSAVKSFAPSPLRCSSGVAVGTFSSIYIAAPVLILFKLRPDSIRQGPERKKALGTRCPKSGKSGGVRIMARGIEIREAHFPGRAPIDTYGNGGFRFADMSHRGSILCLPSGILWLGDG
jgi:hypothetical protein